MKLANQQGSALMVVIIVMLMLSVVGMSVLYLMEGERDTTYDEMHVRGALYAAELGLRQGERVLLTASSSAADELLEHVSSTPTEGVDPQVPNFPQSRTEYDLTHLGTYLMDGGVELANQDVGLATGVEGAGASRTRYSLYLRNNPSDSSVRDNDSSTDARGDNDFIVNLISVGWVELGGGVMAVKILEEEYTWVGIAQEPSVQKLSDAGGTSSGQFGG